MNTYKLSATPESPKPQANRPGQTGRFASSDWLTRVPKTIIKAAIAVGAQTGPHQGSGMRKRMSQFDSDRGQPVMTRRKT